MQNFFARLNKEAQKRLEEYNAKTFQVGDVVNFRFVKPYFSPWCDRPIKILVLNDSFVVLECSCAWCYDDKRNGRKALIYTYYLDEIEMRYHGAHKKATYSQENVYIDTEGRVYR